MHPRVNAQIISQYIVPIFVFIVVSIVVKLTLGQDALVYCSTLTIVRWLLRSFDHVDHSRYAWPLLLLEKYTYRSHVYWRSAHGTNIYHETGLLMSHRSQILL